ncbi:site-specific integrase [Actinomadura sp. NPDC049382]|uniref:tyrosine-type recombinase/integrase n=1 Tax=Actinomadura sp. NPDC049382 TaxID=3158220 RepID=UPI00342D1D54
MPTWRGGGAQARDKVKRNVVLLCEVPTGQPGRPSKALTFEQADTLLSAAEDGSAMGAYIVLSLLTGARTEELRELAWSHVVTYVPDRKGWVSVEEAGWQGEEFAVYVWRSVRRGGDTKTSKSRRTLKLPRRCVVALAALWDNQAAARAIGKGAGLVFPDENGDKRGPMNVLRAFRRVASRAGLNGAEWTPRELRHSFVSLLSDSGMPLEQIARLVGHSGTNVTETIYRHQIRPVIEDGATAMDQLFPGSHGEP